MSKSTQTNHTKTAEKHVLHPYSAAFEKTAAARAALADTALLTINLDVQIALTSVLGAVPGISTYRDAIKTSLPTVDIAEIDHLKTYAEALAVAHADYLAAAEPAEALPALLTRATQVRDQLLMDATTLASRCLIDGTRLVDLKKVPGYLSMTSDLGVLVRVLREKWSEIASKSAIQPAELEEAESLFEKITSAYGARQQQSLAVAATTQERQRAYTLLLNAYDEARRAISFLRWREDDLEKIAPSLWAGRGGRGNTSAINTGGGTPVAANPPGTTPATATHAAADPTAPIPAAHGVTPPPPPVAVGMPGGNPFTN